MATKVRTVYLIRDAEKNGAAKPHCFIEVTASGSLTYGLRVAARSLKEARKKAQEEFRELRRFAETMKRKDDPTGALGSVK